ncbi:liver-expressed antimicrobial peptide 2-like protein [Labeo rohita]|uniref:Liver-expressed antimicrobial peptide 2 n=1 Tax=Labeo rohita TaxID=84645 RepID=A0A498N7L2_LABRO|nr:liver-expressed antimicrobial peptide 2-like protein [Labeo rohita]RXN24607.1 liver-expressed antimicrobial peptide 2-like protein [Labeo rohita]
MSWSNTALCWTGIVWESRSELSLDFEQAQAAPIDTDWASGLIHRAKRSLLWRWNTLKPVGSGCRDHYECGTNYCR